MAVRGNRRRPRGADQDERPCPPDGATTSLVEVIVCARHPTRTPVCGSRRLRGGGQRVVPVPTARRRGRAAHPGRDAGGRVDDHTQLPAARDVDLRAPPPVGAAVRTVQSHRARRAGGERRGRMAPRRLRHSLHDGEPGRHRGGPSHQLHDQYNMDLGRTDQWSSSSSELLSRRRWC